MNEVFQSELVIGSCYPFGADQDDFNKVLREYMEQVGYQLVEIRLSDIVRKEFEFVADSGVAVEQCPIEDAGEKCTQAWELMQKGTQLRKSWGQGEGRGDSLALLAIAEIATLREGFGDDSKPACFYIRSLKHPEEVERLRKVYGDGFYFIGLHAQYSERIAYLESERGMSSLEADFLVNIDQGENDDLGQQTRKAFQLCDFFLKLGSRPLVRQQLHRFLDLIFGHPHKTPSREEYGMFLAFTASLRSADLSRQVGASIFSEQGDVISLGCNDVPKGGGGLYWPDDEFDAREFMRGYDSNDAEQKEIILGLMKSLPNLKDVEDLDDKQLIEKGMALFKDSRILSLTEFGRIVHAEMDALLSAARLGISVQNGTLFTTTFPCHNCAKHIIAAGVSKIYYVEPYPKSLALKLHWDALELDGLLSRPLYLDENDKLSEKRVKLIPFTGVAARRYTDIFAMGWSSGYKLTRKEKGEAVKWSNKGKAPRVPMLPLSYLEKERDAMKELGDFKNDKDQSQARIPE